MTVTGSTSLPIGPRDKEWNGSDARRRVIDFYTTGGKTKWRSVEKAFFWTDRNKPEVVTSYSLGFADIVNGKLVAMPRGIFAVAGGHGVTRIQIPSSAKTAIKRKVNAYYRKMKAKFPNDDFDFEPPFSEVREADTVEDEDMALDELGDLSVKVDGDPQDPQERVDYAALFLEASEKFFDPTDRPTSFADLASVEAVRQAIQKVFKTVYDFEMLARGVAHQSETPGQLVSGLKSLTDEMGKIFSKMTFDSKDNTGKAIDKAQDNGLTGFINRDGDGGEWEVNQGKSSAILKNSKGEQFFYGRFTNNIWDKEDEVLLTKAHQEFVDYLDDNPEESPELWDWHERETARTHKAVWWDYSDGFLHSIWPITPEEAKGIEAFMEEFEPGMSHGFKVLRREGTNNKEIAQYRTYEASILPLEVAANEWTTFDLIKEKEEEDKDNRKMFSPKKQRALELLSLGKYTAPLGKASESDAQSLDENGVQRKSDDKEKVSPMETPEVPEVPETPEVPEVTKSEFDFEALQVSIVEGFSLLTEKMAKIADQVATNTEALKGIKEKKGQSPSVAAWVAAQKANTSVGDVEEPTAPEGSGGSTKRRRDPDPFLGDGPEETPFEIDGHLLANY